MSGHSRRLSSPAIALLVAFATIAASIAITSMAPATALARNDIEHPAITALSTGTTTAQSEQVAGTATDEEKLSNVNLLVRSKIQTVGWKKTVKAGKSSGTMSKKGMCAVKISLTGLNGVSGSIRYKVISTGKKKSATARDGKSASTGKASISAVRIWLSGKVSQYYDVYYRGYIKEYGWLDWACNKQVAGTTKLSDHLNAVQVKLVKKGTQFDGNTEMRWLKSKWQALELKYRDNEAVRNILEVKYTGGSRAEVVLRKKGKSTWKTVLSCKGFVGKRGVGKTREGLKRTPSGDFGITSAFGIKSDPGSILPYVKVTEDMYWCSDRSHYNELIDIDQYPHDCSGEHLIDYSPHYDYGLFFDYNTNPIRYGAGSAFFVHCTDGTPHTAGCIAVSKSNMLKIIRNVMPGSRLCIFPK